MISQMNLTVKLIQCTENKDPKNSGSFRIHISVYASAAVTEREVWGTPEILSGFHEDKGIVMIILRHFFALVCHVSVCTDAAKAKAGKTACP